LATLAGDGCTLIGKGGTGMGWVDTDFRFPYSFRSLGVRVFSFAAGPVGIPTNLPERAGSNLLLSPGHFGRFGPATISIPKLEPALDAIRVEYGDGQSDSAQQNDPFEQLHDVLQPTKIGAGPSGTCVNLKDSSRNQPMIRAESGWSETGIDR
jgi:hypothetical protein